MIASVVLGNLMYLIAAVALIIVGSLAVAIYHHRPKSIEANMDSFNRGLKALAPDAVPARHRWRKSVPAQARSRGSHASGPGPAGARLSDSTRPQITVRRVAAPSHPAGPSRTEAEAG